jgi:transcriptional regulator GlxA family with amidase domain
MEKKKVGILLFNEVELLDFAGPYEVFSTTDFPCSNDKAFTLKTLSQQRGNVTSRNGLRVVPDADISEAGGLDLLIIPGGYGAEVVEIENRLLIDWVAEQSKRVEIIASVCTGAFLLAAAGLLSRRQATTHWKRIEKLQRDYPDIEVVRKNYVDTGPILTSGGVAAGIAMSLHLVERFLGREAALETARDMEYHEEF